ncbi:uncharacterized protein LOC131145807 [Malania oleifera]|uniref:uncharacterized protein LOC131145807 n=1 Tax=Malania oleifera TaxID=397392 RepID=UPI0025AE2966|nr:uncharacterized protein LOC131145807 [Malania oleifera]
MTSKNEWYGSLKPLHELMNVIVGNDAKCPVEGTGSISFKSTNGQGKTLSDVLYVPQIGRNLLFVAAITDRDYEVRFLKTKAEIIDSNGSIVGEVIELAGFWHERCETISCAVFEGDVEKGNGG